MKKNTNIFKKIAAITAIVLAFFNLIIPRQTEISDDMKTGITVCVIDNDDDDDDIESIAGNNDPKINLAYDYDDDELIDMVANDSQL